MCGNARNPLPKGWPRTIRSGIVHVISLAQFSLTHTRSWAVNNWNARIRLKQKNNRHRQEFGRGLQCPQLPFPAELNSRASHARATLQASRTVLSETPSAYAISFSERPAKRRSSATWA